MSANFCNKCAYWEKVAPLSGDMFGVCHNVSVKSNVAIDGKEALDEDGTIWTAAYFGCVHWRDSTGVVIDFEKHIDSKTGKPKDDE